MKVISTIIKYIISIILAIATILFLVINLTSSTILEKNYLLSKLEEVDYYNKIQEEIKSNFENYIYQSGLDESAFDNIVSKEKIQKDTQIIINNIYDGTSDKIDTQEIKDNLNENIEKTMVISRFNITQRNAIDTLADKICSEYTKTISSFSSYETQIHNVYEHAKTYIELAKKGLLITIGVTFILLLLLNMKKIYKAVTQIGVSLTVSGIFYIFINTFVNMKIKIQALTILNTAISEALRNILAELLNNIKNYGYILLVIGLILIIIGNIINSVIKNKKETEEE